MQIKMVYFPRLKKTGSLCMRDFDGDGYEIKTRRGIEAGKDYDEEPTIYIVLLIWRVLNSICKIKMEMDTEIILMEKKFQQVFCGYGL